MTARELRDALNALPERFLDRNVMVRPLDGESGEWDVENVEVADLDHLPGGWEHSYAWLRIQAGALGDVAAERLRQERKCAEKREGGLTWLTCADPRMPDGDKLAVLMEEVGEVARELCDARAAREAPGPNLRVELIQVAAVALAWAEGIDAGGSS